MAKSTTNSAKKAKASGEDASQRTESKAKEKLILLDAGHGGIVKGEYVTYGKRSNPFEHNGKKIEFYEGISNREQVARIQFELMLLGIKSHIIAPENEDTSLTARVMRANKLHKEYNCFYLSIHSNAHDNPSAHGWEVFTSYGYTSSDLYAEIIANEFRSAFPDERIRYGSVAVGKEANFRVLTGTHCAAALTEDLFMTSPDDLKKLIDPVFRQKLIDYKVKAIVRIYNEM